MNDLYQDKYYDHFAQKISFNPPVFEKEVNYMMRFSAPLKSYNYKDNNLVVIYFKKGHGSIEWYNKRQLINDDTFIVTNPSDGWLYLNEKEGSIDVLSMVITEYLKKEFYAYHTVNQSVFLDNPLYTSNDDRPFIESAFAASHYPSGRLLKNIYAGSLEKEFEFSDAQELTIAALNALHKDQKRAYRFADCINVKKQSTKLETLKRLLIAREYIHDNLDTKVSLEELSKISCLSKFHLFNSFKTVFGKTPHQYSNTVKLLKAKELLSTDNFLVGTVSTMIGFNDVHSFSKLFKKKFGVPPSSLISKNEDIMLS